jgi:hypothetical protein
MLVTNCKSFFGLMAGRKENHRLDHMNLKIYTLAKNLRL